MVPLFKKCFLVAKVFEICKTSFFPFFLLRFFCIFFLYYNSVYFKLSIHIFYLTVFFSSQITNDRWAGSRAGGCGNHPLTYPNNPRYQFTLDNASDLLIELKGPKQFQIGFDIILQEGSSPDFSRKSSGAYR